MEQRKTFHARVAEPFPETSHSRAKHEYTRNDFIAEDKLERKESIKRHGMYDAVLEFVDNVDSLYVLGPGEAKMEFQKYVASLALSNVNVKLETSDKMTEPQLAAKVREHFKA